MFFVTSEQKKQLILPLFTEYYCICDLKPELLIKLTGVSKEKVMDFIREKKGKILFETEKQIAVQLEELPVITKELFGKLNDEGKKFMFKTYSYQILSSHRNEFSHIYDSPYSRASHCNQEKDYEFSYRKKFEFIEAMEKEKSTILDKFKESPIYAKEWLLEDLGCDLGYIIIADLIVLCNSAISMDIHKYHLDSRDGLDYVLKNNKDGKKLIRRITNSTSTWIDHVRKNRSPLFDQENLNNQQFNRLTLKERILENLCTRVFYRKKECNDAIKKIIHREFGENLRSGEVERIWGKLCMCLLRKHRGVKKLVRKYMRKEKDDERLYHLLCRYEKYCTEGYQTTLKGLFLFLRNILKYTKKNITEFEGTIGGGRSFPWEFKVHQCKIIMDVFPGLLQVMVEFYEKYQFISRRLDDRREVPIDWKVEVQKIQPQIVFKEKPKMEEIRCKNTFVLGFSGRAPGRYFDCNLSDPNLEEDSEEEMDEYEELEGRVPKVKRNNLVERVTTTFKAGCWRSKNKSECVRFK